MSERGKAIIKAISAAIVAERRYHGTGGFVCRFSQEIWDEICVEHFGGPWLGKLMIDGVPVIRWGTP